MSDEHEYDEAFAALERMRKEKTKQFQPLIYQHEDYLWDRAQEKFWDRLTYQLVGAIVVDKSIPETAWRVPEPPPGSTRQPRAVRPSSDIQRVDADLTVHSSTWHPGKPQVIENMMADDSGYTDMPGTKLFNTYRAPKIGAAISIADVWVNLVTTLFPNFVEHEYFFDYCAHMIQKPHEKCNAGVVLSGCQGVGKDAILFPLKECVGFANAKNIGPDTLFEPFNEFVKSSMLIVDEVRSQSDDHKATTMYNRFKELCAAPPNMLRMNMKFRDPVWVANVCRLFITTNEVDSMFVPHDDRRLFILHTDLIRQDEAIDFPAYWEWVKNDGAFALHAWLKARDISKFNPAAEPPKTAKHSEVAKSWGISPDSAIAVVFDGLRDGAGELPKVLSGEIVREAAKKVMTDSDYEARSLKSAFGPRNIKRTMTAAGFVGLANPAAAGGVWKSKRAVDGKTHEQQLTFYRRADVPLPEALEMSARILSDSLAAKVRKAVISEVPASKGEF